MKVRVRVRVREDVRSFCAGLVSVGATKVPPWDDMEASARGVCTGSGRGAASAQPVDGGCSFAIAPPLYGATPPLS